MRALRISPAEIVLLRGLFEESALTECGDVKECDEIMEALKSGKPHQRLAPLLINIQTIREAEVIGEGVLA
ncbi:MAG: hypothetical protein ABWU84_12480, partial [Pyrobaculum sp.]